MKSLINVITLLATAVALLVLLVPGCKSRNVEHPPLQAMDTELQVNGKLLSEKYCSGCHLYPEPELLDKKSWEQVLVAMKPQMAKSGIQLSSFEWLTLEDYYKQAAPAALETPASYPLETANTQFTSAPLAGIATLYKPAATLVTYDQQNKLLVTGDAAGNVAVFEHGKPTQRFSIPNLPVDAFRNSRNQVVVLGIGNFFPSEEKKGSVTEIDTTGNQQVIIDKLIRPVHFLLHDFNGDGEEEYLISSFGSTVGAVNSGRVSLFYLQDGAYLEKTVKELPGATKTVVGDFNNDGRSDFMALYAQGREGISLFLNKGNFEFEEKQLLEFPAVYGSNSFSLVDINNDAFPDIVYTNGDNSDYSTIFKGYHGVRIFLNDGRYNFTEKYFYHINGASKVIARDFDGDGDLDLVALAMFPDLVNRPQETLVYLENTGDLEFKPSYLEKDPTAAWFVMDAGDVDQDGKEDLIVGANLMLPVSIPGRYKNKWAATPQQYKVFRNMAPDHKAELSVWERFMALFE